MKKYFLLFSLLCFCCLSSVKAQKYQELAKTPPMGWNSWNKFACDINEEIIRGVADKMVESGLRDAGYVYLNLDDCWHVLLKVRDFDAIKIGETLNYSYSTKSGVSTGNIYSNSIHSLLTANPLMPLYDENGDYYDYYAKQRNGWNYDASAANPIANTALSSQGLNLSKSHNLQASAYVQIQPIKNLIFKSQFGYKMSANTYRSYDRIKKLSSTNETTTESVSQNAGLGASWTLDNTLAYKFTLNEHTFDMMVGQSAERWGLGDNVSASGKNTLFLGSWVWDDVMGTPWGNGGYLGNTTPGWWTCNMDAIQEQAVQKGYPGDGKNGSMLFSLKGAKITKSDGTTGSFTFDMSKKTKDDNGNIWAIGKLYTKSVNVLLGIQPNEGNAVINEYDILKLDAQHLYLACKETATVKSWQGCWFWCFRAK